MVRVPVAPVDVDHGRVAPLVGVGDVRAPWVLHLVEQLLGLGDQPHVGAHAEQRVAEDVVGGQLHLPHPVPELERVAAPARPPVDLGERGERAGVGLDALVGHFFEQAAREAGLAGLAEGLEQRVVDEDVGLEADLPHLVEDELDAFVVAGLPEHLGEDGEGDVVGLPAAAPGAVEEREHLLLHVELGVDVEDGGVGDLVGEDAAVGGIHALEPLDGLGELSAAARGGDERGVGDVVEGHAGADHVEREALGVRPLARGAERLEGDVEEDGVEREGGERAEPGEEGERLAPGRVEVVEEEERVGGGGRGDLRVREEGVEGGGEVGVLGQRADGADERLQRRGGRVRGGGAAAVAAEREDGGLGAGGVDPGGLRGGAVGACGGGRGLVVEERAGERLELVGEGARGGGGGGADDGGPGSLLGVEAAPPRRGEEEEGGGGRWCRQWRHGRGYG
nr:unnamed protein product [Digitaria exilis]